MRGRETESKERQRAERVSGRERWTDRDEEQKGERGQREMTRDRERSQRDGLGHKEGHRERDGRETSERNGLQTSSTPRSPPDPPP